MSDPLMAGQPLPELKAQTAGGAATTVQAHFSSRTTLLYFLHGTWCPICVGQFHLFQRYLHHIRAAGADLVVVTGDDPETLTHFLAGADTVAVIVDRNGIVHWSRRWPDHQEPSYEAILQALGAQPVRSG
jgi:peroxiredoxin